MLTHLQQVLTAAGLSEDQVKALVELPDAAPDFKTETYVTPLRDNVATALKNDAKFYENLTLEQLPAEARKLLETTQYGRSAAVARQNVLKAAGLTEDDFKELGDEGKKLDKFIPELVRKLNKGDITAKQFQDKLLEANQKIEQLEGKEAELVKQYDGKYQADVANFQFANSVLAQLASTAGFTVPPKLVATEYINQLKARYAFAIVNDQIELRQKDKPDLRVMTANGTKMLTLADAITEMATADAIIDKKRATTHGGGGTTTVTTSSEGLKMSGHIASKVQQRIERDKATSGAK